MDPLWRIEMFGGLRAVSADRVLTRFRSHKTGALLAYLAFHADRSQPRELLIELLWPEETIDSARMRLRTALSSLRRQLEPPGIPAGAVIRAHRLTIGLNPAAVSTDVAQFEAALQSAARMLPGIEQARLLIEAIELYRGALLPGYFEAWIMPQQQRLAGLFAQGVRQLVRHLEQERDFARALDYAGRVVAVDPLHEEAHVELIRLYAATGQPAAARQYQELERQLREELGEIPSEAVCRLMRQIERGEFPKQPASPVPSQPAANPDRRARKTLHRPLARPASRPSDRELGHRGYLPPLLTRFFGREVEIARLRRLLLSEGVRLVTLTGPGGSGKTRLALETAARLRDALDGAVWFVPLADLSDPRRIIDAIYGALRLPRLPQAAPLEQVVDALSPRPSLLVLDNFEQLLPAGVPVVRDLLEQAPLLQCLVTSRQILELTPEREIMVGPLPVPGVQAFRSATRAVGVGVPAFGKSILNARTPERLNALAANESVALFVDRAQRVRPDFQLTRSNALAVAELCRWLEGIPLAIELAAAWSKRLAPARMLVQLEQCFDLLVGRQRDLPSRHQTLRAALDWSYQLLSPERQRFFAQLFVFRGGCTVEAAAAVAGGAEGEQCIDEAREQLIALRDASLVHGESAAAAVRFCLLETLREYAAEQLSPEQRAEASRRHAAYYLTLVERAGTERTPGAAQKEWLDQLEVEHDNLRAALDWAEESPAVDMGLALAAALLRFWLVRGYLAEGRERLHRLLALPGMPRPTPGWALALENASDLAGRQGDHSAAQAFGEQALSLRRRLGEKSGVARALCRLGSVYAEHGMFAAAKQCQRESLALYRELGLQAGVAKAVGNLGLTCVHAGEYGPARQCLEEALSINQALGYELALSYNLNSLGLLNVREGNLVAAYPLIARSLQIKQRIGNPDGVPYGLDVLAEVAAAQGQAERSVRLIAASEAIREAVAHPRCPPDACATVERLLDAARASLDAEAFAAAWAEGRSLTLDGAVAYALETPPST